MPKMIYNSMAVVIRMSMSCAPFLGTYLPPYRAGWLATSHWHELCSSCRKM